MTGGNFTIAETGTFVVRTNEGNADIGAAVPPLHIASIGIEKLVPRVEDMGVFLRLLSRSSVGSLLQEERPGAWALAGGALIITASRANAWRQR